MREGVDHEGEVVGVGGAGDGDGGDDAGDVVDLGRRRGWRLWRIGGRKEMMLLVFIF